MLRPAPWTHGGTACGRDFSVARDRAGPPALHRESVAARRRTSLTKHMEQWGATVHPDKWQHLRCRRSPTLGELEKGKTPESIPLNPEEEALRDENMEWGTAIEMVGSWLAENGDNTRDLSERWYILCKQLPGLRFNHSWSIKLWQSTVMACLLYGCEMQYFSAKQLEVLRRFVGRCLRGLLRVEIVQMKGVQTMTDVRKRVKVEDVAVQIHGRALRWLGRVIRQGPFDQHGRPHLECNCGRNTQQYNLDNFGRIGMDRWLN